jgi:hypothetical protein
MQNRIVDVMVMLCLNMPVGFHYPNGGSVFNDHDG